MPQVRNTGTNNSYLGGNENRGGLLELARHNLDLSFTQRIGKGLQLKFNVQNLLNQEIRMVEDFNFTNKYEPVTILPDGTEEGDNISSVYNPGRYYTLSVSYSF